MSESSTILAIETATPIGSVALRRGADEFVADFEKPHQQASHLIAQIESLLQQAACSYDDLDALAVTVGPGSFTGIRIGLAVARMIHFARPAMRLLPYTTLECLAMPLMRSADEGCAVLSAGKGQVYAQYYDGAQLQELRLLNPDQLPESWRYHGNIADVLKKAGLERQLVHAVPQATDLLALHALGITPKQSSASPLYVRSPDAEISTKPLI